MLNMKLIFEAIDLVNDFFAAERIYESNESILNRAISWYEHTEITDAETLAAVVMYGQYDSSIRFNDIKNIKDYFFPSEPFVIHIHEIEMALKDSEWR